MIDRNHPKGPWTEWIAATRFAMILTPASDVTDLSRQNL